MQLEHVVAHPAHRRYAAPLLLVHGAWHGAWCWEGAMADLAARGFEVHAVSIRGHGASDRAPGHRRSSTRDYGRDLAPDGETTHFSQVYAFSPSPSGELIAALTRLGKTPVLMESIGT
ncbi:MAG: alpha/beta hydrolase [Chloroflexales bacterium]|nr:alpha/beta hydrolase [Chloroflexales bacterium]